VLDERRRLELRQDLDFEESRVDEIVDDEVDDPVPAAEGYSRFGPVARERIEPLTHTTGQNHGQDISTSESAVHRAEFFYERSGKAIAMSHIRAPVANEILLPACGEKVPKADEGPS